MEDDDPIVDLAHKLETLIARTTSIESIDRKIAAVDRKIEEMIVTLDKTHDLVNSRMTALTEALKKAAALAALLAGEEGEARGITIGREQTADPPPTKDD